MRPPPLPQQGPRKNVTIVFRFFNFRETEYRNQKNHPLRKNSTEYISTNPTIQGKSTKDISQFRGGDAPILLHPRSVLLQRVQGRAALLYHRKVVLQIVGHQSLQAPEIRSVGADVQHSSGSGATESRHRGPRQISRPESRVEGSRAPEPLRTQERRW